MKRNKMTIEVKEVHPAGTIPVVGWADPWADGELHGYKVHICIAGGCKMLMVKIEDGNYHAVDLVKIATEIAERLIAAEKELEE